MTFEQITRDVRYAARTLQRARTFGIVAVVSLALGIGANTTMFSLINGLLFTKPPLPNSHQVVELHRHLASGSYNAVSQRDLEDMREGAAAQIAQISAYLPFTGQIGGTEGPGVVVLGELVNAEYFELLGLPMASGRGFLPEEDRAALASPVAIVGYRFWETHLQSDPRAVGQTVRLNGRPYTIIGIAPRGLASHTGGIRVDVWAPLAMQQHLSPFSPDSDNLFAIARLTPGTTPAAFEQALAAIARNRDTERGRTDRTWQYTATTYDDILFSPSFDGVVKAMAALLLVVVGLVLAITCANLAGFLLARATDRQKEMAIRLATGATRGAIIRQMLIEALFLATIGGALGLLASKWAVAALLSTTPPGPIPLSLEASIDFKVLLFTILAILLAAILVGLAPALRGTRMDVASTLRATGGGSTSGSSRLRHALISGQLALSMVLLISAGLFIQNMMSALAVSPGFSVAPSGLVTVDLRGSGYDPEEYQTVVDRLRESVAAIPGVTQVTTADRLPMTIGNSGRTIQVPGFDDGRGGNRFYLETAQVEENFFATMSIPMVNGETFRTRDAPVAVINRIAAERLWPGQPAVGRSVTVRGAQATIIGVSEVARDRGITENPRAMIYTPLGPDYPSIIHLLARGSTSAPRLAEEMRRAVLSTDERLFVVDARTMDQHLGVMYFLPRMAAYILSGFALLALVLGCIGLFGAVSHAVARRAKELAIRMSLGATGADVVVLVVKSAMTLVLIGATVGLVISWSAAQAIDRYFIDGRGNTALTFVIVPFALGAVALLAAWIPARRAGKVNPMAAIRAE